MTAIEYILKYQKSDSTLYVVDASDPKLLYIVLPLKNLLVTVHLK